MKDNIDLTLFIYPDYYYFPYIKTDHEIILDIISKYYFDIDKEIIIIKNIEIVLETIDKFFEKFEVSDEEFEYWINESTTTEISEVLLSEVKETKEIEDMDRKYDRILQINKERHDDIVNIINIYHFIIMSDLTDEEIIDQVNKDLEIDLRGNEDIKNNEIK